MLCGRDGLDARLIRRYHVLYVYERIDPAAHLEKIQRLLDHLPDVPEVALRLGVVHLVAQILLLRLEEAQRREKLSIIRHQRLPDRRGVGARRARAELNLS